MLILQAPSWLKDLVGACFFYTALPVVPWPKPQFNRIARFAPVIGLGLGGIQSSIWIVLTGRGWSYEASALLLIAIGIALTGGLHIDGLMDTGDGLAAGKSKSLEAMRDSRVGSFGSMALILALLIQISALIQLQNFVPFALPIAMFWGRFAPLWAIGNFPYLHIEGNGSFHKKHWRSLRETFPSLIIIIIFLIIILSAPVTLQAKSSLLVSVPTGLIISIFTSELLGRKLGGQSGDSYGASVVITETLMLLFLSLYCHEM